MNASQFAQAIAELDARGSKHDDRYRALLSTMSKRTLRRGETWRQVCLQRLGSLVMQEDLLAVHAASEKAGGAQ
jgi:hypothetical protein